MVPYALLIKYSRAWCCLYPELLKAGRFIWEKDIYYHHEGAESCDTVKKNLFLDLTWQSCQAVGNFHKITESQPNFLPRIFSEFLIVTKNTIFSPNLLITAPLYVFARNVSVRDHKLDNPPPGESGTPKSVIRAKVHKPGIGHPNRVAGKHSGRNN